MHFCIQTNRLYKNTEGFAKGDASSQTIFFHEAAVCFEIKGRIAARIVIHAAFFSDPVGDFTD